jgi:hypothetical protein
MREEGVALVRKFDGEFSDKYFDDIMNYLEIDKEYFKTKLTDNFRSPHLWGKTEEGKWKLRHNAYCDGLDD